MSTAAHPAAGPGPGAAAVDVHVDVDVDVAADPGAAAADRPVPFGGFHLGGLALALPMVSLREVVPLAGLVPLPCPAACVVGAMALRGVSLPVVDLRLAMGQSAPPPAPGACVVVMVENGWILGLLADGVTGVFHALPSTIHRMQVGGEGHGVAAHLLAGSVRRGATGIGSAGTATDTAADTDLVALLSPAALAHLPQVPLVQDPEPERQHLAAHAAVAGTPAGMAAGRATARAVAGQPSRPMMLARCGRIPLAIDAMGVHATLAHPRVLPSVLAMGHCRGVIAHDGALLPLVDLLALCGLGHTHLEGAFQAFVVRLDTGLVAFAVDVVVDVVRVAPGAVITVPAFALPQPALFAGALPVAALPAEVVARADTPAHQFLVVDAQALKAHPDVAGLAATNTPVEGAGTPALARGAALARPGAAAGPLAPRRSMITYALAGETATPIEQVAEILPYMPEASVFAGQGAMLGLVVNRGRSIPVLCLSRLHGLDAPGLSPAVSVLVVACDGDLVGFAVPRLQTIDQADYPLAPAEAAGLGAPDPGGPLNTRALARVGSGDTQRLLRVLDLQQLARQLRGPGLAQAA